ncbi:Gamma-tubulin complex component [Ooceraea biroi]|uniref:Gamma-tubulin complex component n=1 Tax=Ooceraea biroi TaxID=2015173 RepID=A0A026VVI2_OOCBI|nr:Gamma-tubulin complex component [Ooceraea biroi]
MSTRVLNDIHNDLKQLITAVTSFEEDEEGFRICERFCLSNIKHHRYLSVNSHATKEAISALVTKFSIHGKYEVAKKFRELIDAFLSSFDFEQHPQYDLQWSLLTFLLDLSTETHKSNLDSLRLARGEYSFNLAAGNDDSNIEEIDWAQYLKEGQENFFCDYKSDGSESEWSDEEGTDETDVLPMQIANAQLNTAQRSQAVADNVIDKFSRALVQSLESRKWLASNVQTDWWNNLECQKYPVAIRSCDANICDIWHGTNSTAWQKVATLSEYQVCRELLWMFHVQTSMVVFQESEPKFSIRPNISIPSLTTVSFESILSPFCECFSMIHDIQKFGADLQPICNEKSELQSPPLTYEAYNAAVNQHLYEFRTKVINVEKDVMKQENCNTLLSLSADLRKHLNTIRILYDIHKRVVIDWKASPNWKCASRLLSCLYYEMQNSPSRERANICTNLYLCSLTVYLNVIDTWLSEGRLEDWRDEFIIVRSEDASGENDEQSEKFIVRLSNNVSTDPVMQFLLQKVQRMGHSIELLISLDRITDIWRMDGEHNDTRISLNTEFQDKLLSEISKYSPPSEEIDASTLQTDEILLQEYDADMEKNIVQQLSTSHNPFFMKAMEDYLPCELYKSDTVDAHTQNTRQPKAKQKQMYHLYKRLQKIKYILPLQNILENTLSEMLSLRYNSASRLVKNIMVEEYKLQTHLQLLRLVYMMEAGHVMNKFYQILFYEIENNQMWANSYFLSCILEEIFSQYWPNTSSRWSVMVHGNVNTHQVLQAVNSITLHYAVEWPISIMLTKKVLEKYNEIFRFHLKLKWALWTLNNLRFSDLEGSRSPRVRDRLEQFHIRRLESLRFWLLHAIGSIHTYLSGQVLQSLGFILEKDLAQADSLDTIVSVHNEYLNKVHEHCLLTEEFEDIMTTINNMIEMCIHIRDRWSRKKLLLATAELDVMEHSYIKYHTYLALALHNAIQHKDADYCKLMPASAIRSGSESYEDSEKFIKLISDLSRTLLTEIAHQSLPPSGIPVPIPKLVYGKSWQMSLVSLLPVEISLTEYEQTFSYMRWYQYEEQFAILNSSSYTLRDEIKDIIASMQYDRNEDFK